MPNQIVPKISIPGQNKEDMGRYKKSPHTRPLTHRMVADWVRDMKLDEPTTEMLVAKVNKTPATALENFGRNINVMIARVREELKTQ